MASKVQVSSSLKALLVGDNAVDRKILWAMLHKFQCEITLATNGKEAVDLFHAGKKFDIVFLGKDMPIMTGPEAVVKIRAMGETDLKIIGVSADNHAMEESMSAGADSFVPKPMQIDCLGSMIKEVIKKKKNAMKDRIQLAQGVVE